jgi:hypothetical protein
MEENMTAVLDPPGPAVPDPSPTNDAAVVAFQKKFQVHYALVLPVALIQAILAALSSVLGGCLTPPAPAPTPASLKTGVDRLIIKTKIRKSLRIEGVPLVSLQQAVDATVAAIKESTDEELTALIAAGAEAM